MAPYNQHPQSNAPLRYGSMGRGGHNNGGRGGGKKGRGGYNNNGSGGTNNNQRASYGNYNYGPRAVPDMQTPGSFPPGSPAPWGMQYGGGYPNPAVSIGFQPRRIAAEHEFPLHVPSYANTPAHNTPIATPVTTIAMPAAQPTASAASSEMATPVDAIANGEEPETSQVDTIKSTATRDVATTDGAKHAEAPSFVPIHASTLPLRAPNISAKNYDLLDVSPFPQGLIVDEVVAKEGQTLPVDEPHERSQDAFKDLDHNALVRLQSLKSTLAAQLQKTLANIRRSHHAQQASSDEHRASLLSLLLAARESELAHEKQVRRMYDGFTHKMTEACKQGGESKDAAQLKAIQFLKAATEESRLATEHRDTIERYRNDLLVVDNVRIISATAFADAVRGVVINALGGEATDHGPDTAAEKGKDSLARSADTARADSGSEKVAKTAETSHNIPAPNENNKVNGDDTLPDSVHEIAQQSVFERQPETEHQSIDEVLDRMKAIEERTGLRQPDEKATSKARESTSKSQDCVDIGFMEKLDMQIGLEQPEENNPRAAQESAPSAYEKLEAKSTEVKQQIEASILRIPTEFETVKKAVAITLNGHTIIDHGDVIKLLKDDQARKDSFGSVTVKEDSKREGKSKGKLPMKKEEVPKEKAENKAPEKSTASKDQRNGKPKEPSASTPQANAPAAEQDPKRKRRNKNKNKNKRKGGGDGNIDGSGKNNGGHGAVGS